MIPIYVGTSVKCMFIKLYAGTILHSLSIGKYPPYKKQLRLLN